MKRWNKKGQTDLIGNVISTIPKPLIFLIFILLIGVVVSLLAPVFNAFGVFCDSSGEVVKLTNSNLFDNVNVMSKLPSAEQIKIGSIDPDRFLRPCTYFYNGSDRFKSSNVCNYCDGVEFFVDTTVPICMGDAYNLPYGNLSWIQRNTCGLEFCDIPDGYYFNSTTGMYECLGGDCDLETFRSERDELLNELGSTPLYLTDGFGRDYKRVLKFGCNANLKVEPKILNIPMFRLEYWAIGLLIILMLGGIIKFAKK